MVRVFFFLSPAPASHCKFLTCPSVYWISNLGDRRWILRKLTGVAMFTNMQTMGFGGLCENLEARRLLSVSLVSGVLTVKGTNSEDSVVVSLVNGDATKVDVAVNGVHNNFDFSSVAKVVVYGGDGNDLIKVDNQFGNVLRTMVFKGGAGNDLLIGGVKFDELLGGLGEDELRGMGGSDLLDGEDGLDKLVGYAGNDTLLGGLANDLLLGNAGNDILKGGFGDDLIEGGAGLDSLFGNDGIDHLMGELDVDFLDGGIGDDFLDGGAAIDKMVGGLGEDTFLWDKLVELLDKTIDDIF